MSPTLVNLITCPQAILYIINCYNKNAYCSTWFHFNTLFTLYFTNISEQIVGRVAGLLYVSFHHYPGYELNNYFCGSHRQDFRKKLFSYCNRCGYKVHTLNQYSTLSNTTTNGNYNTVVTPITSSSAFTVLGILQAQTIGITKLLSSLGLGV